MRTTQSIRCRAFIGRRRELAALDERWKALAQSSGSFVLISGEAGIGKTRLLDECLDRVRDRRGRNVVNTECIQGTQQPLGPIRALASRLASTVSLAGAAPIALRALAQLIPEQLGPDVVEANAHFPLEKEQLFGALWSFLTVICAKRSTLLTIEDIQWSDETTLEFLGYLARRMDPMRLLVIATCRSDELDRNENLLASMAQLFRARCLHRLELGPLTADEIRSIIDGTAEGHASLPEQVARDIGERSDGNPFFAEELVKHYLDHSEEVVALARLPLSIRSSITQRLVDLPPDERNIIAQAAVLGQRFDPAVLAAVLERDMSAILPALRHALDLDLLVDDGSGGRLSCGFRHALTRQTVYDSVPSFETRSLHAKILSTLEAFAESDRFIEDLAYHAWESGDVAKTIRYNERAGDAAFAVRALPEALIDYRRALEAASDAEDKARLLERSAAVERVQGHSREALDALEAALSIRLERGDINGAAGLVASIVGQRYNLGDQGALAFGERFFLEHRSMMSAAARDQLLVICARVAGALYDFGAAERLLAAVADPVALAPTTRQNWLIVQLMRHSYSGNVTEWRLNAEQVDQLLPQLAPEAVVSIEAALAMTGIVLGANEQVERALERAERLEAGWGFRGQRLYALATKASYLFQRGRLQAARACVEVLADSQDFHPARRVGALVAAHLGAALGDDTLWQRFAPDVLGEAREHLNDPDCVFILGAHAGLLARGGAVAEAQADLRAAVGSLSYASPEAMYVLINAARLLTFGELAGVDRLAAAAAAAGGGSEIGAATLALVRGTIAHREGRTSDAALCGREAAQRYALLGWPLLEAAAHELAGEESNALRLYRQCGADADVRRLSGLGEVSDVRETVLSSRELEVAELVAEGLKNAEIAKRLDVGKKTVEKHIASAFDKLGLRSRSQLAGFIAEMRKAEKR